jgi:uncharacterized protein
MLRTSSYTIFVDLPDQRDELLLIHGFSGAYDKVSRPVASYLRSLSGARSDPEAGAQAPNGPKPRADTVALLKRRGYLTEKTHDEEEALFSKIAAALHERDSKQQPGYVLMPTYSCNLRCPYCFQSHMRTEERFRHLLCTMTPEVADRIFAAMPAIEERHGLDPQANRKRNFLLFGGEPLLAASRPIVEHICRKALALEGATLSAISNGTELDSYRDLLGPGKIAGIQITCDGVPAEHDRKRAYPDGSGSFARIAANISMALDLGTRITLRINLDRANVGWLPRIAREIASRGWRSYSNFVVYAASIHSAAGDTATLMDSWVLRKQLAELQRTFPELRRIGHLDDHLRVRLQRIFAERQNPMPGFKASFCAAHSTMYIFDAFADIYACWEHTGDRQIRIGHIAPDGALSFDDEKREMWRTRNVLSNPRCRRCRYAFYCGGGCANLAWGRTGDFHTPYCDGFAHRFRNTAAKVYLDFIAGKKPEEITEPACDR